MGIGKSLKKGMHLTGECVEEGIDFGEKNIIDVAKYIVVGGLIGCAGAIAGILLGIAAFFLLQGYLGELGAGAVAIVLALIPIFICSIYSFAAQFGAIEFIYTKKRVPYFRGENVSVAVKWTVFMLAVSLLLIVVVGVAISGAIVYPLAGILVFMLAFLVIFIVAIVAGIVTYYVMQELAINKRGPWEAIVASYRVIKSNFWETIIFAIILAVASYVVELVPNTILYMLMQIGIMAAFVNPLMLGPVFIVVVLYMLIAILVGSGALILKVGFYRKITASKKPKTKKAS